MNSGGYRARLQSDRIWEERSGDGGDGENPQATAIQGNNVRGKIEWIQEQLARDNGGVSSRGYRARLRSEGIWDEGSGGWRR
jgi:hypothetical protein